MKKLPFYCAVFFIVVYSVFPFYWAINSSLKPAAEAFTPALWPAHPTLANYKAVFSGGFQGSIVNSLIAALSTVLVCLFLAVTASYALARIEFRGRKFLLLVILGVSMFPQVAILSGMYEMVKALGLYNRLGSLTLSYMVFTLPFTVWVLTTFMKTLPKELEEAAVMDGASTLTIVFKIFMPLLAPALVTTGLLAFIAAWNEFLFALTFLSSDEKRTVPVAIAMFTGNSSYELPWNMLMAASVVVTVPIIALVLVFQKRIVAGLTAGSVKG